MPVDPVVGGPLFELERGVGETSEGDGQPEVHRPVRQYARQRLTVGEAEAGQHRDQHELHDAQSPRGDRDGRQDVGQAVGGEQVDGGDEVAEGGDEHPQGGGVEQPVGRRPGHGPPHERPVVHEHGEALRQPLDE